jgi:hypothetical protein
VILRWKLASDRLRTDVRRVRLKPLMLMGGPAVPQKSPGITRARRQYFSGGGRRWPQTPKKSTLATNPNTTKVAVGRSADIGAIRAIVTSLASAAINAVGMVPVIATKQVASAQALRT